MIFWHSYCETHTLYCLLGMQPTSVAGTSVIQP